MLRYPVLMVHGMGFRDNGRLNYWGRIPKVFEDDGNRVFYGNQDSNGTIENNAVVLKQRIEEVLLCTNAERLNVIAHSKGGLDMRYAISTLDMGSCVASLTTVSTPHYGSRTLDKVMKLPSPLIKLVGKCSDLCLRLQGDKQPDAYQVFKSFTTDYAADFNEQNKDDPNVYYQSYAFVMRNALSDIFMALPWSIINAIDGENDGLVTPDSASWGDFKGIIRGNSYRGLSHCDEVDLRRRKLSRSSGKGVSDILEVYERILSDLKEKDF